MRRRDYERLVAFRVRCRSTPSSPSDSAAPCCTWSRTELLSLRSCCDPSNSSGLGASLFLASSCVLSDGSEGHSTDASALRSSSESASCTHEDIGCPEALADTLVEFVTTWQRFDARAVWAHVRSTHGLNLRKALARGARNAVSPGPVTVSDLVEALLPAWQHSRQKDMLLQQCGLDDHGDAPFTTLMQPTTFLDLFHKTLRRDLRLLSGALFRCPRLKSSAATVIFPVPLPAQTSEQETHAEASQAHLAEWCLLMDDMAQFLESSCLLEQPVPGSTHGKPSTARARCLLPLPLLDVPYLGRSALHEVTAAKAANLSILGLSCLFGARTPRGSANSAQQSAQGILYDKAACLLEHLQKIQPMTGTSALCKLTGSEVLPAGASRLKADGMDLLHESAKVVAHRLLPADLCRVVTDPASLFPSGPPRRSAFPGILRADRAEHGCLVAWQLRCRKVDLSFEIAAGGSVFAVGKKGTRDERDMAWGGSERMRSQATSASSSFVPNSPYHAGGLRVRAAVDF